MVFAALRTKLERRPAQGYLIQRGILPGNPLFLNAYAYCSVVPANCFTRTEGLMAALLAFLCLLI